MPTDFGFRGLSAAALLAFVLPCVSANPFVIEDVPVLPPQITADGVAWGDFDGDGDLDALVAGETNGQYGSYFCRIYRNDGPGTFTSGAPLLSVIEASMAWGDFDNDGDLDAFVTGYRWDEYVAEVHRNDGGSAFAKVASLPGVSDGAALWCDLDNDGDLDLLYGGLRAVGEPDVTWIYRNNGDSTFTDSRAQLPGAGFNPQYRCGDLDRDGDTDLLIAGNGRTYLVRNNGNLEFALAGELPGVLYGTADLGDFDNDGNLDILLAGDRSSISGSSEEISRIYRNAGGFQFTNINASLVPVDFATGAWGDWDTDGDLDAMLGGSIWSYPYNSLTRLYANNDGVFALSVSNLPSLVSVEMVRSGDYDNDGDVDVLLPGRVLRNNAAVVNNPPSGPGGSTATLLGNHDVLLTWTTGADLETPAAGLSYNLRVGTTPGGGEVLSAQSRASDGKRLVAQAGIAADAGWHLRNLRHGTYFWSVQSVDAGFAASPFGAEATFTITNSPPRISVISDRSAFPGQSPPPIPFTVEDDETPVSELILTASSSNTNVVRTEDIIIDGSGTTRAVHLLARYPAHGASDITISVTDADGRTATSVFTFTVEEFTRLTPIIMPEGRNAWGDYDNDGWLDLVVAEAGNFPVFRNLQNGMLTNSFLHFPSYGWYTDAQWSDFNGDGLLDLFYGGYAFRSIGAVRMTNSTTGLPLLRISSTAWSDFDNDGRVDLAISGEDINHNTTGGIYRNLGGDRFTNMAFIIGGAGTLAPADFDNDGDLDLLASGFPLGLGRTCRLYRNELGTFTHVPLTFSNLAATSASWGDFDNDGDVDLIIAGGYFNAPSVTRIYRNDGGNTFVDIGLTLPSGNATTAWLDYDNDGLLDAFVGVNESRTNSHRIYRNQGNGTFAEIEANLSGAREFADMDNDGDLDAGIRFRNNAAVPNTPPNAPHSLISTTILTSVRLSWAQATDVNQTGGHSYNLRVGRSPGAEDVFSSLSDPLSGWRRVVGRGNAGQGTTWHLTNLAVGAYYWSVQAIDHTYAGSAWSPEQMFIIPPQPPITITHAATNETFDGALLRGEVSANGFSSAWRFEYGPGTNLTNATTWIYAGNGTNLFAVSAAVSALELATTYTFRLTATNVNGFMSGAVRQFVTRTFTNIVLGSQFNAARVAWGDFDNDGDLDLAKVGADGGAVFENVGSNLFQITETNLPAGSGGIGWGDFNNDGYLDLYLSGLSSAARTTRIYRNNGDYTFTDLLLPLAGGTDGAMGDFNNDGRLDLVVVNSTATTLYRNAGNNSFAPVETIDGGENAAFGDYNNDGFLDLLVTGASQYQRTTIYRNNRNGTFTALPFLGLPDLFGGSVDWGDFNNDGWLDFAVNGTQNGTEAFAQTSVYRNIGGSSFGLLPANLPRSYLGSVHWGDYDRDGALDLMVTGNFYGAGSGVRIYRGNAGGTFLDINLGLPVARAFGGWADDDNDGGLDYYAAAPGQIHRNLGSFPNLPPPAPQDLSASISTSNDVLLAWSTTSALAQSLSYSLRVGTAPGGIDVIAPPADSNTGYRRLPQMGGVRSKTWILRGLPRGTFYWSVQSVDGGFSGSAFAGEATFVITNGPPVLSRLPDTAVAPGQLPASFPFTVHDDHTPVDELALTVSSSNTSLLAQAGATISGTGTNRNLILHTSTNASGSTLITMTATDASGLVDTYTFRFSVEAFTPVNPGFPAVNRIWTSWGDYDRDGDFDLAYAFENYQQRGLKVFRNDVGTFTDMEFGFIPNDRGAVQWLDVNNDGWLDLFVMGGTNAGTYLSQPDRTFVHRAEFALPASGSYKLYPGDFDNDGSTDLLVSGSSFLLRILFNRNGVWNTSGPFPSSGSGLAIADFDADGDLDFVSEGQNGAGIWWNDGQGSFRAGTNGLAGPSSSAAAADFDGDGNVDVALSGSSSPLYLYRNSGKGTFSLVSSNIPGVGITYASDGDATLAASDYDNDGRVDLLLSGCTGYCSGAQSLSLRVLRNAGNWNFDTALTTYPNGYGAAWADFDSDGDLDIVHGGLNGLLRNNINTPHSPPAIPTGLTAAVVNDGAILSWVPPPGTVMAGLRVGTTPGGIDIVSPHSEPISGHRHLAPAGTLLRSWKLRSPLPVGDYYWSVQTIDSGWAGSAFAPEQMLSISNTPPVAEGNSAFVLEDNPAWIRLSMFDFNGQPLTATIATPPTNGTITLDLPYAIYQPSTNFFGRDSFTFTAFDGTASSTPAFVSIQVQNVADIQVAHARVKVQNNQLNVTLTGEPYQRYQVESSDDLRVWTPLQQVQLSVEGQGTFSEEVTAFPKRFYRFRATP